MMNNLLLGSQVSDQRFLEIYKVSFTGTILFDTLVLMGTKGSTGFFVCPCGGNNHQSTRSIDKDSSLSDGFSTVIHCRENNYKWMIISKTATEDNVTYVSRIIHGEEEKFLRLLDGADPKIKQYMRKRNINKITAQDLFILHTTHGYDPSIVEGTVGGIPSSIHDEYLLLMEEHSNISRCPKKINLQQ